MSEDDIIKAILIEEYSRPHEKYETMSLDDTIQTILIHLDDRIKTKEHTLQSSVTELKDYKSLLFDNTDQFLQEAYEYNQKMKDHYTQAIIEVEEKIKRFLQYINDVENLQSRMINSNVQKKDKIIQQFEKIKQRILVDIDVEKKSLNYYNEILSYFEDKEYVIRVRVHKLESLVDAVLFYVADVTTSRQRKQEFEETVLLLENL